jgi:hypothetical protein
VEIDKSNKWLGTSAFSEKITAVKSFFGGRRSRRRSRSRSGSRVGGGCEEEEEEEAMAMSWRFWGNPTGAQVGQQQQFTHQQTTKTTVETN